MSNLAIHITWLDLLQQRTQKLGGRRLPLRAGPEMCDFFRGPYKISCGKYEIALQGFEHGDAVRVADAEIA